MSDEGNLKEGTKQMTLDWIICIFFAFQEINCALNEQPNNSTLFIL